MTPGVPEQRRVDVVILTALRLEFEAVLRVDAGAVTGSVWEHAHGPSGLPVAFRSFVTPHGPPLRVAVAVAADMGAVAAVNALLPLIGRLGPRCIAMCGVCAGRRGKVGLGDVVAADRLYYHDTGKQLPGEVQHDLTTYKLRDDWKAALEGMNPVARFRDEAWFRTRPLTTEWRLHRALVALRDGIAAPWDAVDPAPGGADEWPLIVAALRERGLLARSGRRLTRAGRRRVDDLRFRHRDAWPDLGPDGTLQPFRLHVAPIGSGSRVVEDEAIWSFVSKAMRKTLGLEMEAAALGELVHRQRQHRLDAVVMKGVMDFADHGRDDHFKEFAARASAECLLWFLRDHVATEPTAGLDDVLTAATAPLPDHAAPSVLLDARYQVVPWHEAGRSEVLEELDAWADDSSKPVAVRLVHGAGGVGKTRLAIEWIRRRRQRHELDGFLVADPDRRWLERLCAQGSPVVAVIDYAERRADLVSVLQRVAALPVAASVGRRIRVLLLARSDGDWWKGLPQRHPELRALLDACPPIALAPVAVTPAERRAVFAEAARRFAAVRHRRPVVRPPIALDDVRFDRVLYLHMLALAAVEGIRANASAGALGVESLMDEVLDHEERFWVREASDRSGAAIDAPLARQLVVAATLRGGMVDRDEVCALCERLEGRPRSRGDDALIALLHDLYAGPGRRGYLPGLEPDLLGEAMVLRVARPGPGVGEPAGERWIDRVLVAGDAAPVLVTVFAVLGRAAASAANPSALRAWIARLLAGDLPGRAVLALRAAREVGHRTAASPLGDVLADALERDGSIEIARALAEEGVPAPSVSLRRVAAWQAHTVLQHAPRGDDVQVISARADLLLEQGALFGDAGDHAAALAATSEAVALYQALAARSSAAVPGLALSLHNLNIALTAHGDTAAALAAARAEVELCRAGVPRDPEVFEPALARALDGLGHALSHAGQRAPAVAALREAVERYRALAARDRARLEPELAASLDHLSVAYSNLGQHDAAAAAIHDAVTRFRALAERNRDRFEPMLATSLDKLSTVLGAIGQVQPALAASREAVRRLRALDASAPGAFRAELANSLDGLARSFEDAGQVESALAANRESVELRRALAERQPAVFHPGLARSLDHLGGSLQQLGHHEAALAAIREATELHRALAKRVPEAFEPELAVSVGNLGLMLSQRGEHEPALAAIREAVAVCRKLVARTPQAFEPDLAHHLSNLGTVLHDLGRHESALAAAREAVRRYRRVARRAGPLQLGLADSLLNLGVILADAGRGPAAVTATREAIELYRVLAGRFPVAQQRLCDSLLNLGRFCYEIGRLDAAIDAFHEAELLSVTRRAAAPPPPRAAAPRAARRSRRALGRRRAPSGGATAGSARR